jgi:ribonuclease PH
VNASCLALLEGGCSLRGTFAAVTLLKCGDKIVVDPSKVQEKEIVVEETTAAKVTVVYSNDGSVLHVNVQGRIRGDEMGVCLAKGWEACGEIFEFYKEFVTLNVVL